MSDLEKLAAIVEEGRQDEVAACVRSLINQNVPPEQIVNCGFMPGLTRVGEKFDSGEYFISNMLLSARVTKMGYEILRMQFSEIPRSTNKKIVLGTVQGDLHDIGKNLVATSIRSIGIEVVDLGVDVPAAQFVKAVEEDSSVAFVGLSALLTTTISSMRTTVKALKDCSAADRIRIFVGGAPLTPRLAKSMGADYYTKSAFDVATLIQSIVSEENQGGTPK